MTPERSLKHGDEAPQRFPSKLFEVSPGSAIAALGARFGVPTLIAAYLAFVLLYLYSFGRTGWHSSDYEYIMASVWRIAHGEVPYRDFIYHKPPGSLWLHVVWLAFPGAWGILASRVVFYLQIAASGLLPILWGLRRRRIVFGWRLLALGVAALALALHNFPVMPWQTSDGIFFATVGTVALLESITAEHAIWAIVARAISSAAMAMALLCKQSFFLLALVLAFFALAELCRWLLLRRRSQAGVGPVLWRLAASAAPALAIIGGTYLYLRGTGALAAFISQFRSQSTSSALVDIGFSQFGSRHRWLIWVSALIPILRVLGSRAGWLFWGARIVAVVFLAVLVRMVTRREDIWAVGAIPFFVLLGSFAGRMLLSLGERLGSRFCAGLLTDGPMLLMHLLLLTIAWSTQLSLGYPTPLLGIAGMAVVLDQVLPEERNVLDLIPVLLAAVVVVSFWKMNQQLPYRELSRDQLTEDLAPISPKLAGIRTNRNTFARYAELKALVTQHALALGKPYAVVQNYPGIHWLLGDRNPTHIDWAYPDEIQGFEEVLWNDLLQSRAVAIVPKEVGDDWWGDPPSVACESKAYQRQQGLSERVVQEWRLIASGRAFCVFAQ
jgi:hypothetical protein